jgi:hypothetical protein
MGNSGRTLAPKTHSCPRHPRDFHKKLSQRLKENNDTYTIIATTYFKMNSKFMPHQNGTQQVHPVTVTSYLC